MNEDIPTAKVPTTAAYAENYFDVRGPENHLSRKPSVQILVDDDIHYEDVTSLFAHVWVVVEQQQHQHRHKAQEREPRRAKQSFSGLRGQAKARSLPFQCLHRNRAAPHVHVVVPCAQHGRRSHTLTIRHSYILCTY